MEKKVKCEKCGKEYLMTNPKIGCPYCKQINKYDVYDNYEKNKISNVLNIFAYIIFFLGFIGGFYLGMTEEEYGFNFIIMFITCFVCLVITLLFIALAEIIQILDDIKSKK